MKKLLLLTIVGCVAFLFQSCQKSDDYPTAPDAQSAAAVVPASRTIQVTVTSDYNYNIFERIVVIGDMGGYMSIDDIPQSAILASPTMLTSGQSFTVHVPDHLTGNYIEFYVQTSDPMDGISGVGFQDFGSVKTSGTDLQCAGLLTSANNYTIHFSRP